MLFSVPRHFILIFESDYGGIKLPEGAEQSGTNRTKRLVREKKVRKMSHY